MTIGQTGLPFGWDEVAALLDRTTDLGAGPPDPSFADVTAGIDGLGLPPGTPVIIALSNSRRMLELYFAVLLTGGVPLAVSPATSSARIAELARRVDAGAVLSARPDVARLGTARTVGGVRAVLLRPVGPGQPAGTALMLTSGTSGLFSACLHRVDSLLRNARRHATAVGLRPDDTVLVNLPLFYSYAVVAQAFAALATGARLLVSGPPFSPAAYPGQLEEHDITSSSITPTIARLLLHRGEKLPRGLRMLTVGGDALAPRHVARLLGALPDTELYLTYGLTEAGPRVSTLAAHREPAHRHGSVGLPLDGVRATLRDLAEDGTGELLVHTDTALLARVGETPGDRAPAGPGAVATGDRFRIDEDGYLHFAGRLSDFIVVRGEKVSLAAVRRYVQSLPGVVGCTTTVGPEPDGYADYALDVRLDVAPDGDEEAQAARVRRAVLSFLLPAERPKSLEIGPADQVAFRK
ncbi:acyl--CoA ligase [Kitasatospora sp. NBC_01560]|uniref:class I adenylate-forming enzyme family protein n=1 Tax=Kitasatospora sp. NBC_01560 TaxID=2975965 RepID=UPI00386719C8